MSKRDSQFPTIMTVIRATLVQESALSVSGIDRESTSDLPFAMIDGEPVLSGRGLKGAAVAMARRFFHLPPSVTEPRDKRAALARSSWWFANATRTPSTPTPPPSLRPGVGILQKTGARADGVFYDREVIEAGTTWTFEARVDHRLAANAADPTCEAEKILLYVLEKHWKEGRCWLGGGVARGLGWCRAGSLRVHRLDSRDYDAWVSSGRVTLPPPITDDALALDLETTKPARSWVFLTRNLEVTAGEYRPDGDNGPAWGVDMLAIAPHDVDQTLQRQGSGTWALPPWITALDPKALIPTNRTIAMSGELPLLPGSSLRGPLRHAYSRAKNADGEKIEDPHLNKGKVPDTDPAGKLFGTVERSSNVLIRDGRAEAGWCAARMHMHAEDEFSAGSYGTAKRNAVRLLRATFPIRIVVEGGDRAHVEEQAAEIERLIAIGKLGHLPIGGHKTHGAGGGVWRDAKAKEPSANAWDDAGSATGSGAPPPPPLAPEPPRRRSSRLPEYDPDERPLTLPLRGEPSSIPCDLGHRATLSDALTLAHRELGDVSLTCWWCEPTIDLAVTHPPATFGTSWDISEDVGPLAVDELMAFTPRASFHLARTSAGYKAVVLRLVAATSNDASHVTAIRLSACLHQAERFSSARLDQVDDLTFYQWHQDGAFLGYTAERSPKGLP